MAQQKETAVQSENSTVDSGHTGETTPLREVHITTILRANAKQFEKNAIDLDIKVLQLKEELDRTKEEAAYAHGKAASLNEIADAIESTENIKLTK